MDNGHFFISTAIIYSKGLFPLRTRTYTPRTKQNKNFKSQTQIQG